MASLLQDLLPDSPRESGVLNAAAQWNVAGALRTHAEQGLQPAMALRLAATALAATTAFPPETCEWAARELAVAIGLLDESVTPVRDLDSPADSVTAAPPRPAGGRPNDLAVAHLPGAAAVPLPAARPLDPATRTASPPKRSGLTSAALVGAAIGVSLLIAAAVGYLIARPSSVSGASGPNQTPPAASQPAAAATQPSITATTPAGWIAQLASIDQSTGTAALDSAFARVQLSVPQAQILNSTQYASLRPGYWVIYYPGPFANGIQALDYCTARRLTSRNKCFGRYLSTSAADLSYQCYPPAGDPSGNCYHPSAAPSSQHDAMLTVPRLPPRTRTRSPQRDGLPTFVPARAGVATSDG